jgi:hypothetical protein
MERWKDGKRDRNKRKANNKNKQNLPAGACLLSIIPVIIVTIQGIKKDKKKGASSIELLRQGAMDQVVPE